MKKADLITYISMATGYTKKSVTEIIDCLPSAARVQIESGEAFVIGGVVKLTPVDVPARAVRNPKTGETVQAPARVRVKAKSLVKL